MDDSNRVHPLRVLQDGLFAGLVGAFVVAGVHFVADLVLAEPLRTPTALGALLVDGPNAARGAVPDLGLAFRFTCLHMAAWVLLGIAGSYLTSLVDAHPKRAPLVFGGFSFFFISLLYVSGAFSVPGLEPLHLWAGTLLGAAAAATVLVWRHPMLSGNLEREHLTPTTRAEIERALVHEIGAWKAYRAASERFSDPRLEGVALEKSERVELLRGLVRDLGLEEADALEIEPAWSAETAGEARERAIASERETVAFYDRFLAVVPEIDIRDVFMHLRQHPVNATIPELQSGDPVA